MEEDEVRPRVYDRIRNIEFRAERTFGDYLLASSHPGAGSPLMQLWHMVIACKIKYLQSSSVNFLANLREIENQPNLPGFGDSIHGDHKNVSLHFLKKCKVLMISLFWMNPEPQNIRILFTLSTACWFWGNQRSCPKVSYLTLFISQASW